MRIANHALTQDQIQTDMLTPLGSDTLAPTVLSINRVNANPTNATNVQWAVTFSENVTGVDLNDFALATSGVTSAALTSVTPVNGTTYTVTASTGAGSGTLGLNLVDNDTIVDGSTNRLGGTGVGNGTFTGQIYSIDKTAPSVTINQAAAQTDPTSTNPINFTVVFSETVTGFAANDISFAGSTVGGTLTAAVSGSGTTYNVAVSGMTGTGTVIANVIAGAATDAAGNASLASTSTDNTVTFDANVPTVLSINRVNASPTNAASVQWTVTFSEAVTGVDLTDFALAASGVSGATLTGVTPVSGTTYTVTATTGTGSGTLGLNLVDNDTIINGTGTPLGGAGVGNGTFTGQIYSIDKAAPSVTINQAAAQTDPTSTSPINFTVVFSETVTGFAANDISFAGSTVGGTLTAAVSGSGTTYNVVMSGMTGTGTVVAGVLAGAATDAAGNASLASTSTDNTVTFDTVAPTVAVTAPTSGSTLSGTVTVTADASDLTGVVGVQFLLDGASLGAEDTTSPYSISWNTTTAVNGTHTLAARARDAAGNISTASPITVTVANTQTAGLTAGYAFDETTGTTAADASGHGITGTLTNGPTYTAGKYGNALTLDGVNDYVNLGNPTALQLTGSMTHQRAGSTPARSRSTTRQLSPSAPVARSASSWM